MRATRRYLWRDGGAGTIDVWFEDGRFFHRFDAEDAGARRQPRLPARHLPRPLRLPRLAALAGGMARHRPAQGLWHRQPLPPGRGAA